MPFPHVRACLLKSSLSFGASICREGEAKVKLCEQRTGWLQMAPRKVYWACTFAPPGLLCTDKGLHFSGRRHGSFLKGEAPSLTKSVGATFRQCNAPTATHQSNSSNPQRPSLPITIWAPPFRDLPETSV